MRELTFLILNVKEIFNQLKLVFTKALILQYFNLECYIRIQINTSGYTIGRVLSQLNSNSDWITPNGLNLTKSKFLSKSDSKKWHSMAYFSRKIIFAETYYKTHGGELLFIIETFKTWQYYFKSCEYKVLILPNHNKLWPFIDIKSLSSYQLWWA